MISGYWVLAFGTVESWNAVIHCINSGVNNKLKLSLDLTTACLCSDEPCIPDSEYMDECNACTCAGTSELPVPACTFKACLPQLRSALEPGQIGRILCWNQLPLHFQFEGEGASWTRERHFWMSTPIRRRILPRKRRYSHPLERWGWEATFRRVTIDLSASVPLSPGSAYGWSSDRERIYDISLSMYCFSSSHSADVQATVACDPDVFMPYYKQLPI